VQANNRKYIKAKKLSTDEHRLKKKPLVGIAHHCGRYLDCTLSGNARPALLLLVQNVFIRVDLQGT
jgi:hypothetical protein